jgi:hypothetical protein
MVFGDRRAMGLTLAWLACTACTPSEGRHVQNGPVTGMDVDAGQPDATQSEALPRAFASTAPLQAATKGYELYVWQEGPDLRFMLITGTNRLKTLDELTVRDSDVESGEWVAISGTGLSRLQRLCARIPRGTSVVLTQPPGLTPIDASVRAQIEQLVASAS